MRTIHLRKPLFENVLKARRYRLYFPGKYYERKQLRLMRLNQESVLSVLFVGVVLVLLSLVIIPRVLDLIFYGL